MKIPDQLIEEIRARADLVEIIAEVTPLKRSGRTFRGPCPLHGGKGPNFSVDPSRNLFKCFVCGESGDLFSFPMKRFGMSFVEAIRWVADRVGIEIPEVAEEERREDPQSPLHEANAFAAAFFRERLLDAREGEVARDYLAGRGLTPEVCERFGIGWAPENWSDLANAAAAHGIDREVLLELGLLKRSARTEGECYDAFRGRIIFPIEDLAGRVVAFGGRILGSAEAHIPKYLNSPESAVYIKRDLLYGLHWSRGAIRREQTALVVEGYLDFLSLAAHGVENAVAPLGTALTAEQAELLARYARRVILIYDSDSAGLRATFRAGDELLRTGVEVLVATLPEGADPDSLVRSEGAGTLRRHLHDAVDILERKIQILERRNFFASVAGKRRAVDTLLPTVRATADELLRELYIARIAERAGVPAEVVTREVESGQRPATSPRERQAPAMLRERRHVASAERPASRSLRLGSERNLILLFLRDESWLERGAERLAPDDFLDPLYREVYLELLHLHAEGGRDRSGEWLLHLPATIAPRVEELLGDPEGLNLAQPERFFHENVRDITARREHERLAEIDRELLGAEGERQHELLREKIELRRAMDRAGVVLNLGAATHGRTGEEE